VPEVARPEEIEELICSSIVYMGWADLPLGTIQVQSLRAGHLLAEDM